MVINMGTTIVEEVATDTMVITIMVDSGETIEATREVNMLVITIAMDSTAQIPNTRRILAKWCASIVGRQAIMQMTVRIRRMTITNLPRRILVKWSVSRVRNQATMLEIAQKAQRNNELRSHRVEEYLT